MSQHDYIIANDTGANVRSDLNNALAAIASNNSGATEPSTTYAFQWWYDTTNNLLKLRNSANSAWITLPFDPTTSGEVNITANSTATADLAFSGGDVTFGDNDKAIFGAGSDLQIYHDGSNSYIQDTGTGLLYLDAASDLWVRSATSAQAMINAKSAGAVTLYNAGSAKLATTSTGIDVTGTVTADDVTVNGGGGYSHQITTSGSSDQDLLIQAGYDTALVYSDNVLFRKTNGVAKQMTIATGGDISFYEDTGTTAKFFWDASAERLGIGTSSPATPIHINSSENTLLHLESTDATVYLKFTDSNSVNAGYIGYVTDDMEFWTNNSERMRIDSSGNLSISTGSAGITGGNTTGTSGKIIWSSYGDTCLDLRRYADTGNVCIFRDDLTVAGTISVNGSSTSYNTSSDYRLKTDVQPMTGATERLKALNPVNFEWISSGERVDGFLAHEAQEVVPEAVTGTKDAVTAYGNVTDAEGTVIQEDVTEPETLEEGQVWTKVEDKPDYQGIDQSKLTPLLTAALQEAIAKIEDLESRLAALES